MTVEGLIEVRETHRFDEDALARYLAGRLPGFTVLDRIRQFHGGQSNPTFALEGDGAIWVLRKKPPGELLPSAHAVDREYRVQAALRDQGVPVPEMYLFCDDDSVIGTPFYVMECLHGRVFDDPMLPDVGPADRAALYDAMNRTLAAIHLVDHEAARLADFGRPGNYFARQIARWTRQWELSRTREVPEMDRLIEWLPANIPPGDETGVVHGDYRLGNLIFAPDRPEVIGVLDWELSTLGHPLGDLGYNISGFQIPQSIRHGIMGLPADYGIPDQASYVADYCRRTGRDPIDTHFYVAFSMFRFAAIAEGVLARGLSGNASSSNATEVGAQTVPYARTAWSLVCGETS